MYIKALIYTFLIVCFVMLGLYCLSKKNVSTQSKGTTVVEKEKKVKKADINYYTSNKANGGSPTFYWDLTAKVDGKKHVISKDEHWMSIFKILDFDEDGYEDALLLTVPCMGGNACEGAYMFCSYSKNGKFTLSEEFGFDASKPIIEKWNGHNSVKIELFSPASMKASTERYILKNGKAVRVENKKKVPMSAIVELLPSDCNDELELTQNSGKKIFYDIDGDGAKDYIHGSFWYRWGLIGSWRIIFANGKKYEGKNSTGRVGVLSTRTNGVHDLVIDFDEIMIWDGKKYNEKKGE